MTSAQGSAGLAWCLGGHAISCAPGGVRIGTLSSMAALSSGACSRLRCRAAWRIRRFRPGVDRFLPFNLTAETEAYGRQHLFAEGVILSRTAAGEPRRSRHIGRDGFLDCGFERPATLAW